MRKITSQNHYLSWMDLVLGFFNPRLRCYHTICIYCMASSMFFLCLLARKRIILLGISKYFMQKLFIYGQFHLDLWQNLTSSQNFQIWTIRSGTMTNNAQTLRIHVSKSQSSRVCQFWDNRLLEKIYLNSLKRNVTWITDTKDKQKQVFLLCYDEVNCQTLKEYVLKKIQHFLLKKLSFSCDLNVLNVTGHNNFFINLQFSFSNIHWDRKCTGLLQNVIYIK